MCTAQRVGAQRVALVATYTRRAHGWPDLCTLWSTTLPCDAICLGGTLARLQYTSILANMGVIGSGPIAHAHTPGAQAQRTPREYRGRGCGKKSLPIMVNSRASISIDIAMLPGMLLMASGGTRERGDEGGCTADEPSCGLMATGTWDRCVPIRGTARELCTCTTRIVHTTATYARIRRRVGRYLVMGSTHEPTVITIEDASSSIRCTDTVRWCALTVPVMRTNNTGQTAQK